MQQCRSIKVDSGNPSALSSSEIGDLYKKLGIELDAETEIQMWARQGDITDPESFAKANVIEALSTSSYSD